MLICKAGKQLPSAKGRSRLRGVLLSCSFGQELIWSRGALSFHGVRVVMHMQAPRPPMTQPQEALTSFELLLLRVALALSSLP